MPRPPARSMPPRFARQRRVVAHEVGRPTRSGYPAGSCFPWIRRAPFRRIRGMHGLMMDYPLTVNTIFRRAESLAPTREIVTRLPDKSIHRYCYGDFARRARSLAAALKGLGLQPGDRVATLSWNHSQ